MPRNSSGECVWPGPLNGTEPDSARLRFQALLPGQMVPALVCVFVLLSAFSFAVNLLTLSSIGRSDDLSWQPRFGFCRNLILSDLVQTATFGPAVIYSLVHRRTMRLGCWCYLQYFTGGVSIFCSLVTITCMALERYLYVCYAISYLSILTRRRLRLALLLVWLYSVSMTTVITGLLLRGEGGAEDRAMPGLLCEPDTMERHLRAPRASALVRKVIGSSTLLLCLLVHAFSFFKMYQDARNAVVPFKAVNVTARNTVMFYCGMLLLQLLPVLFKVASDSVWDFWTIADAPSEAGCGQRTPASGTAAALHVALLVMLMVPPCVNPLVYGIRNVEMRRALVKLFPWRSAHGRAHERAQAAGVVPGNALLQRQAQAA